MKLVFTTGRGYDNSKEWGKFIVKFRDEEKEFLLLSVARKFYDSLIEDKAIWDMSEYPKLLESHILKLSK